MPAGQGEPPVPGTGAGTEPARGSTIAGTIGSSPTDDDFTYVSTWQGFVSVALVIDTFADRIEGWRASRSRQTQFVLDALEQALNERRPGEGLTHHGNRGGQICRRVTPNGWPRPASSHRSDPSATARQCPRRDDRRAVPGRDHPPAGPWKSTAAV